MFWTARKTGYMKRPLLIQFWSMIWIWLGPCLDYCDSAGWWNSGIPGGNRQSWWQCFNWPFRLSKKDVVLSVFHEIRSLSSKILIFDENTDISNRHFCCQLGFWSPKNVHFFRFFFYPLLHFALPSSFLFPLEKGGKGGKDRLQNGDNVWGKVSPVSTHFAPRFSGG